MRHRRRNNTQKILRQTTGTYTKFNSSKKKTSKKPLVYTLLILTVIFMAYRYSDDISAYFNDFSNSSVSQSLADDTQSAEQEKNVQSIPVQQREDDLLYSPIEKRIQLEILNGCGETGVAKKLTDLLKKSKYDVVNSGNYMQKGAVNWEVNESKIIDQVNSQDEARKLADVMGILYSNVEIYESPSPIADLTVVIGKDYKTLAIFQ